MEGKRKKAALLISDWIPESELLPEEVLPAA